MSSKLSSDVAAIVTVRDTEYTRIDSSQTQSISLFKRVAFLSETDVQWRTYGVGLPVWLQRGQIGAEACTWLWLSVMGVTRYKS